MWIFKSIIYMIVWQIENKSVKAGPGGCHDGYEQHCLTFRIQEEADEKMREILLKRKLIYAEVFQKPENEVTWKTVKKFGTRRF